MNRKDALMKLDEIIGKHAKFDCMKVYDGGDYYDTESAHYDADNVLCELLTDLGFGDVVEKYNSVQKWYA